MSSRARQGQHRVVVRRRLPVDVSSLTDQELHRAEVTCARRLHQRGAPTLGLVFLQGQTQGHTQGQTLDVLSRKYSVQLAKNNTKINVEMHAHCKVMKPLWSIILIN